jgi:predicted nucleic acid-binding protein
VTELCDTNVLSELVRREPDAGVLAWAAGRSGIAISVITVEEIACGLAARPNPRVEAALGALLLEQCTVLDVTEAVAARAGRLRGELRRRGVARTQADMLIAATALEHRMPLVTRNVRDFEGLGVALLNPFSP